MQVKNLVSWAGDSFSYLPGDTIELDDDLAHARVAHGLASYVSKEDAKRKPETIKFAPKHPKVLAQEEADRARAAKNGARAAAQPTLAVQMNELSTKLAQSEAANARLLERLEALEKASLKQA